MLLEAYQYILVMQVSPSTAKDCVISSGTRRSGNIAACPSPSAVKSRQARDPTANVPAAPAHQSDDRPVHTCKVPFPALLTCLCLHCLNVCTASAFKHVLLEHSHSSIVVKSVACSMLVSSM